LRARHMLLSLGIKVGQDSMHVGAR